MSTGTPEVSMLRETTLAILDRSLCETCQIQEFVPRGHEVTALLRGQFHRLRGLTAFLGCFLRKHLWCDCTL
ncbi:hypothetical protein KC19_VG340600 [Ceratodon purpureus]|uniref:Uncharacterized protein n=1 Tax=Ceratodon purpureus TaxID=3225 RepID=A0A8T0HXB6_CERPU|nr:hypothetical protein KC19_VG340600 [Ceratodon purpureus]